MIKNIVKKTLAKELARDSILVLILKVFGIGIFFVLTLFLTNNYNANLVGQYDFTRSILLILGGISILGAEQSIIYYAGHLRAENALSSIRLVYKKIVGLVLVSSLILFIVISIIPNNIINYFFEGKEASILLKKVGLYVFFHSLMMLNIETLRALNKIILSEVFRNVFRYLLYFLFAVFLLFIGKESYLIDVYLWCFGLIAIISSIMVYLCFKKLETSKNKIEFSYKEIFIRSYPMALSAMTFFLMQSIDGILLSKFMDFNTVAYYSVAVKIALLTSLALMAVNTIIAPKVAELFQLKEMNKLRKMIQSSVRLITVLSLPVLIILYLFPAFFLHFFGSNYLVAKTPLLILLIGQTVNALAGPTGMYMNMTGKQKYQHYILTIALLLNFSLNWLLIPLYGMNGAAIATTISLFFWNLCTVMFIYKKDKVKVFLS